MSIGKKMHKHHLIAPLIILFGYCILFFFLKDSFLFTPDFASTDVFHFNITYKYHLWQSIRSGIFPLWTNILDGGFPILAESQMGTLFLPYYLIFPLFSSFSHAYAFLFSFHLLILTMGMYLLLKELKTSSILAFLLSVIFAWNGAITFRWVHFIVLQAFSFTPLLFFIYLRWIRSGNKNYLFLLALLLNQMILVGYIQMVFISLLGLCFLYFIQQYPLKLKKTAPFVCALTCGVLLSLPQILPTIQLSQFTSRSFSNSYDFAVSVPFNLNNLCSFFSASCLGSPKDASYPINWQANGVYWENTPYVGELFLVLLLLLTVYYFVKLKKKKEIILFLFLFILFTVLALGKNSPLYFIFSMFPFSIFRTPPRYLLLAVFFLLLYAAILIEHIISYAPRLKNFIYIVLILNCALLISTPFNYHVFIDAATLFNTINSQKIIPKSSLYLTYGSSEKWNEQFLKNGWKNKKQVDTYIFLTKALAPNTNLISGQRAFDIYTSLPIRRNQYIKSLIANNLEIASQSAHTEDLLQLYNITSLISSIPLSLPHFTPVQTLTYDSLSLITYQRKDALNTDGIYYIPTSIRKIIHTEDIGNITQKSSLAESIPMNEFFNTSIPSISNEKVSDTYLRSTVTTKVKTFIALRVNWYPEWKLYIDGKEASLYRTNLTHMGFFVSTGAHVVELKYIPLSLYMGIGVFCVVFLLGLFAFLKTIKRS